MCQWSVCIYVRNEVRVNAFKWGGCIFYSPGKVSDTLWHINMWTRSKHLHPSPMLYLMSSSILAWASRSKGSAVSSLILSCSLLARSCCCSCSTFMKRSTRDKVKNVTNGHKKANIHWPQWLKQSSALCNHLYSPRSPLNRASARGGLRSFSSDSSCGLASNISRNRAGLSSPWGEEAGEAAGGVWAALGFWACVVERWFEDVPGTGMELKSMWGSPGGENESKSHV